MDKPKIHLYSNSDVVCICFHPFFDDEDKNNYAINWTNDSKPITSDAYDNIVDNLDEFLENSNKMKQSQYIASEAEFIKLLLNNNELLFIIENNLNEDKRKGEKYNYIENLLNINNIHIYILQIEETEVHSDGKEDPYSYCIYVCASNKEKAIEVAYAYFADSNREFFDGIRKDIVIHYCEKAVKSQFRWMCKDNLLLKYNACCQEEVPRTLAFQNGKKNRKVRLHAYPDQYAKADEIKEYLEYAKFYDKNDFYIPYRKIPGSFFAKDPEPLMFFIDLNNAYYRDEDYIYVYNVFNSAPEGDVRTKRETFRGYKIEYYENRLKELTS